jgi:hypothetical protein
LSRFALLLVSLALGCAQPLTELVVVVDTDYAVPAGLDAVVLEVEGPDAAEAPVRVRPAEVGLPITLGLVHRGGLLGPVRVTAVGERGGVALVRRQARTSFLPHERRELRLLLLRGCEDARCGGDTTCVPGGCAGIDVDPATLPPFDGTATRSDVGPGDGGLADVGPGDGGPGDGGPADAPPSADTGAEPDACVPAGAEGCNGRDDDCDGSVDEGVCTCDPPCALANATASCIGGRCEISACDVGYADCDRMTPTGCERSTRTVTDCGACDAPCTLPAGLPATAAGAPGCAGGVCEIASCDNPNFGDCNGVFADGCETSLVADDSNCGRCNARCRSGTRCAMSMCR